MKSLIRFIGLSVIFLVLGYSQQDTSSASIEVEILSFEDLMKLTTVTASKVEQKISDAPATLTVITEKQIQERGYKDLGDLLRDLPGFDISENLEGEVRTLVMNRGILGNNKMMVLIDGKKLNSPGGENFVYGNNLPLFDIQRVEIVYGPSSAMYGADAYSGVINMITKNIETGGNVNVSYGKNNQLDLGVALGKKFNDDFSASLSFRYLTSDGINVLDDFAASEIFRDAAVFSKYNNKWDQPVKDYTINARAKFKNFSWGYYRMDAKEPGGPSTDVTQNGISFLLNDTFFWHQIMNKIYLEHQYENGNLSISSTASYSDYQVDKMSGFMYNFGPQYKYAKSTSFKLDELLNYTFNDQTKLVAGFMYEQVNAFPKTNNLNTPFNPDELYDFVDYPNDPTIDPAYRNKRVYFGSFDYQNYALFAEITHKFNENIQVNAGARYDYNTMYKDVVNPRAGIVWTPDEATNIKFLYGQAYIQPSKYNAYEHWSAGAFGFYPNPDLKPEKLKSFSLNISRIITKSFNVSLNTFLNQIENLIVPDGNFPWQKNINLGTPETKGFEFRLDYMIADFNAFAYYSYLDAKQDNGNKINKVAQNKINAGITYYYDKFSASVRVRYSSEIPRFDMVMIEGHTVVDLTLRGTNILDNLDCYIITNNLFNQKYFTASPFEEGGWLMDKAPQPGMNLQFGINYKF